MCRKYGLAYELDLVNRRFGTRAVFNLEPRWNIATLQSAPVVKLGADGSRELVMMTWGLIAPWAKERREGAKCVNARSETIAELTTYKQPFRERRCLVPADGWYENTGPDGAKQPWRIEMADSSLFAFAGIWQEWKGAGEAGPVESFAIVTSDPGPDIVHIHDRQPVPLPEASWDLWLDHGAQVDDARKKELLDLLRPTPAGELRVFPVDKRLNKPKQEGPHLAQPIALGQETLL